MIKAVILLDDVGELILQRVFMGSFDKTALDLLRTHVLGGSISQPILRIPPHIYAYKRCDALHFFCTISAKTDTMSAITFLDRFYKAMGAFLKEKELAGNLRKFIPLIHELLDEMIDNGDVQTTDPEVLKLFIQTRQKINKAEESNQQITVQATGALSHRRQGIIYKRNEIFIDVVESVNAMFNNVGQSLHADVSGKIIIKNSLTGMPDCSFGFNDRVVGAGASGPRTEVAQQVAGVSQAGVVMDDLSFHHCVRLGNFAVDRSIAFVPPDGEFQLMAFRVTEEVKEPFSIKPIVTVHGRNRMEIVLNLRCGIPSNNVAEHVIVSVPMPSNVSDVTAIESLGKCRLRKDGQAAEWRIKSITGGTTATLSMEVQCVSSSSIDLREWRRPPLAMNFDIPMYTASGIEVRYIRIIAQEGYETEKWLTYKTSAGTYQIRW
ncbi:Clathrin associated adaptor complex, mu2 subunit, C-terminal domain protein [Giardia duodenalis]|uniref:Clathrin associated adaptor complex, mu2 subunit, C-terminal domain protein n=1 Tax=Giardia intestinalis TaxID=5741 RepID=V6TGW9_GIAIN|nr:Clathrin associated adaptor complex, mu2 subunit, C-terminal domain protein [Giardia intestinalis]